MVKIAAASTDGKVINQHFGRADKFYIIEADEETAEFRLIEMRDIVPVCRSGDHEQSDMENTVNKLSDCDCVLVSRIGMRARQALENNGIEAFEIPDIIYEAVKRLIGYKKVQQLLKKENNNE